MHLLGRIYWCGLVAAVLGSSQAAEITARGVVFHDRNGNGVRDRNEEGLAGVGVSNQRQVTRTDRQGRWELPGTEDTVFFVIKPRGWRTPLTEHNLPKFYYVHKPAGSPTVKYGGVLPTGPLPASIDFPLMRTREPDRFEALFFGDTQPRDLKEVEYITHDVVEGLMGTKAKFGVTLGDIVFDDLTVMEPLNASIALIGIPWYNVLGNHDINYDVADDRDSDETYTRIYGPAYYSFDYGPVHFVVLDDVVWEGALPKGGGKYHAGLGPEQLDFVKNDLALVPENQLVVFMMHIPLTEVKDRQDLYRLFEKRPYTLSISGHTHWQEHRFIRKEDGWLGAEPHHHVVSVTVSGSWWSGAKDEQGIPHTLMRDGAPNGYTAITFDHQKAVVDFRAARRPADYQMAIHMPERIELARVTRTPVYVNVFGGSERTGVEARWNDRGPWKPLERAAERDPYFVELKSRELRTPMPQPDVRAMPDPIVSPHLWKTLLVPPPGPGTHSLEVRATDMYGRVYRDRRVVAIVP